jgi:hypothetical protein
LKQRLALVAIVTFSIQMIFLAVGISKSPFTPFDEAAHFDYVVKISKGHLPKVNEKYGQTVLEDIACQPTRSEAWLALEPCGSDFYSPKNAPFHGQSSATGYPPNYYLVTAVPYEICDRVSSLKPIECGRTANAFWLGIASSLLALLMVVIGASPVVAVIAAIGFGTLPAVLLQGITVNSDAVAQALAPALVLFALYLKKLDKSETRKWIYWALALFVAIPTKPTILPVAAISTFLLWDWLSSNRTKSLRIRSGINATIALGTGVLLSTVWQSIQVAWRGVGGKDYMTPWLLQPLESLLVSLQTAVTSAMSPFYLLTWPPLAWPKLGTMASVVALLCWILLFSQRREVHGSQVSPNGIRISSEFSVVSLTVAIVGPIAMAAYAWLSFGSAPVQPRYYMATLVLLGAIGLASTSSKWLRLLATSILGLSAIMTASYLFIA